MLNVIPVIRAVTMIALIYAAIMIGVVLVNIEYGSIGDKFALIKMAFAGSTALGLLLAALFTFGWRWLWSLFPQFNRWVFPDLNGKWKMEIHWHNAKNESGVVVATAEIKQTLLTMSMEVTSPGSESETIFAQAQKDPISGRPLLYYMFKVTPNKKKQNEGPEYKGSAILKLSNTTPDIIAGNYWTTAHTSGYYSLSKRSE